MNEGESTKLAAKAAKQKKPDGELAINHEKEGSVEEVAAQTASEQQAEAAKTAEEVLAEQLSGVAPAAASTPSVSDLQNDLASANAELDEAAKPSAPEAVLPPVEVQTPDADEPSMGGTLNATAEQAQHDNEAALENDRNKTILSHGSKYVGDSQPSMQSPFNASSEEASEPETVDLFKDDKPSEDMSQSVAPVMPPSPTETLEDIDRKNRADHEEARSAVEMAYEATPLPGVVPPQPVQDSPAPAVEEAVQEQVAPVTPSPFEPPSVTPPPMPAPVDFSQLPPPPPLPTFPAPQGPLPPEQLGQIFGTPPAAPDTQLPPAPAAPNDPNQFKIPGQ
jgi:hypothetical protein